MCVLNYTGMDLMIVGAKGFEQLGRHPTVVLCQLNRLQYLWQEIQRYVLTDRENASGAIDVSIILGVVNLSRPQCSSIPFLL